MNNQDIEVAMPRRIAKKKKTDIRDNDGSGATKIFGSREFRPELASIDHDRQKKRYPNPKGSPLVGRDSHELHAHRNIQPAMSDRDRRHQFASPKSLSADGGLQRVP